MTTRLSTLNNGLRVATVTMADVKTASLGVWVDAGSRHEKEQQNGIAHMLEHMAFKGTERRSARQIAEEIEAVGGYLNAYTSREHTAYYARVLREDIGLALDILADILQHSSFEPSELERERGVIVQEIGQSQDTPEDIVFDYLQEVAFPGQPMGRAILGTVDRVKSFGREMLLGYMAEHYHGPRMVLAAAGAVDHDDIVRQAREAFAALPPSAPRPMQPARYRGGELRKKKKLEQAHILLAFEGVPYDHADFYISEVFVNALGGGMSSRLFQEVREKRGLAYSIYAFANNYFDSGLIGIYAGTSNDDLVELMPVIAGELEAIADGASDEETHRARAQLKAGLLMSLESSSARCEQTARQLLIFGRAIPVEETIARVDAVDASSVQRFAGKLLERGAPSLAALGPISRLETYDMLAARFG
jgi:predicted Zn-dependent peptidase